MKSYYFGVDIGGHAVKLGIVDEELHVVKQDSFFTNLQMEGGALIRQIAAKCQEMAEEYAIKSIGVGIPGTIDRKNAEVTAANLPFHNTPVLKILQEEFDVPVFLENDANCAAFGESLAGVQANDMVLVTLGTGIGGGIVLNRAIYTGKNGNAGEFGHMIIHSGGRPCACGKNGCWETYASTRVLSETALRAAQTYPGSILAALIRKNGGTCNGKLLTNALDSGCQLAGQIFEHYLNDLAIGLSNIHTILQPEAIVLAGGIAKEGNRLLHPLKQRLSSNFPLFLSNLQGNAGILGASQLYRLYANKSE